jgi:ABC-type uncharacterized transport system substrate-binding protein
MRWRNFIALGAAATVAWPLGGSAQEVRKIHRIGFLAISSQTAAAPNFEALRRGLHDLGYEENKTLEIEQRYADGDAQKLPRLVGDLIATRIDVIVTASIPSALATRNAAPNTPIVVAAAGDFVGNGLAASMEHPGGTVTGIDEVVPGLSAKRLELISEAVGAKSPVAILSSATGPTHDKQMQETESAARALNLRLQTIRISDAKEIEPAFEIMTQQQASALVVFSGVLTGVHSRRIVELAAQNRLPAMYWQIRFVNDGGLMYYGPNLARMFRQSAALVDKILKGVKPGDIPIEYATDLELIINMRAARELGIAIPPTLLARATKLIE